MRVLVVKSSSLGDLVDTLPALSDAMDKIPGFSVDWICEPAFGAIPFWHPSVQNVIPVQLRKWRGKPLQLIKSNIFKKLKENLKICSPNGYDAVIDAQGLIKSSWFLARAANGPVHGYGWGFAKESLSSLSYDHCYQISKQMHSIDRNRNLFAMALGYEKPTSFPSPCFPFMKLIKSKNRLTCIIHASKPEKCWPIDCWKELLSKKAFFFDECVITAGSLEENRIATDIAKNRKNIRILSGASLDTVATVIAESRLCIAVDTGLSHVADLIGCPLITLFGKTDPRKIGPIGSKSVIIQSESKKMVGIDTKTVENAMRDFGIGDLDFH
tara:strand:+ start:285 stop:1265 length:981 start_codon:yes stop_codon:yes gene_type:complete